MSLNKDNISIVLVRPKYSSNIGSCARAMKNTGFKNLVIIDPLDYDHKTALKLSTHEAGDILENAVFCKDLDLALKDFSFCVGTSARLGRKRKLIISTPEKANEQIASASLKNKTAILFGPENKGLQNEDIKRCQLLIHIPTSGFSSLNLSQAVMIITYELSKITQSSEEEYTPVLATKFQLDKMYNHLKNILIKIDFINPENPDHWLDNFRIFFSRQKMRAKDVNILRGVLRQIDWYGRHMYEKGKNDKSQ